MALVYGKFVFSSSSFSLVIWWCNYLRTTLVSKIWGGGWSEVKSGCICFMSVDPKVILAFLLSW
jgi:hypothetical protein